MKDAMPQRAKASKTTLHNILSNMTIMKTLFSSENGMNPLTKVIINPQKETGQTGMDISRLQWKKKVLWFYTMTELT